MPSYGLLGPDLKKDLFALYAPTVTKEQLPKNISYEYLFQPIQDQGQFGSCVAFATTALTSAFVFKRTASRLLLSERAQYSLTKHLYESDSIDQQGLFAGDALKVLESTGYVLESFWPYNTDPVQMVKPVPSGLIKTDHELKGFMRVGGSEMPNPDLVDAMQLALFEHGPIAIGIDFQYDWEDPVDNIFNPNPVKGSAGGHEMVIVGYSMTKQAFRVRNSWSEAWGDHGYAWLPFSSSILPDDAYTISI